MERHVAYVLEYFHTLYGLTDTVQVSYGEGHEPGARLHVAKSGGDYFETRTPLDTDRISWQIWRDQAIPFLFDRHEGPIISKKNDLVEIGYDVIASTFYLLSGWHEIVTASRDRYGRFPFAASLQDSLDVAAVPLVNYYMDILWSGAQRAYQLPDPEPMWNGANFATMLSHDVDKVASGWIEGAADALRQGSVARALHLVFGRLKQPDPWFNFEKILELERDLGVASTFLFMTGRDTSDGIPRADYNITTESVQRALAAIEKAGSEIALHASGGAHRSVEQMKRELDRLERTPQGNRFHYLQFDPEETAVVLENSGLLYDSTLGFAEEVGFRNGCCTPFFLFDHKRHRRTSVVEVPLQVMDTTLRNYLDLSPTEASQAVENVLNETQTFSGVFGLLWHNNYFSEAKYSGWSDVYREIVGRCKDMGSVFLTGREIADVFLDRNRRTK